MQKQVTPEFRLAAFNCPTCGAFAQMTWDQCGYNRTASPVFRAECGACHKPNWWLEETRADGLGTTSRMMWPANVTAPLAHPDLYPDLQADFEEARSISRASPRGAAALLRLVIEKLARELGTQADTIDRMIGDLVSKGLPVQVQQALDTVRVIGNNAVHAGKMDQADVEATANQLFALVNIIVEQLVTQPKKIAELFGALPEGARNGIERRDGTK
jgi:hypothetical protein